MKMQYKGSENLELLGETDVYLTANVKMQWQGSENLKLLDGDNSPEDSIDQQLLRLDGSVSHVQARPKPKKQYCFAQARRERQNVGSGPPDREEGVVGSTRATTVPTHARSPHVFHKQGVQAASSQRVGTWGSALALLASNSTCLPSLLLADGPCGGLLDFFLCSQSSGTGGRV